MIKIREYFDYIENLIREVSEKESLKIELAAKRIALAIKNKNSIFCFGASHAGIITEELFYRAGGLAIINPIMESSLMLNTRPITFTSSMERLIGYGNEIAKKTQIKQGDIIICHSVSGRNSVMLDFVNEAKKMGAYIIAITNVKYSQEVESRHPSKKRLFELGDLIIDNHGEIGDACIKFEKLSQKVAPSSTIVGAFIVNSLVCGITEKLIELGIDPPIFYSANLDGGDEKNKKIFKEYSENIFYM